MQFTLVQILILLLSAGSKTSSCRMSISIENVRLRLSDHSASLIHWRFPALSSHRNWTQHLNLGNSAQVLGLASFVPRTANAEIGLEGWKTSIGDHILDDDETATDRDRHTGRRVASLLMVRDCSLDLSNPGPITQWNQCVAAWCTERRIWRIASAIRLLAILSSYTGSACDL